MANADRALMPVQQMPVASKRFEVPGRNQGKEQFLLSRYEVRGYTAQHQPRHRARLPPELDNAIAGLKARARISAQASDALTRPGNRPWRSTAAPAAIRQPPQHRHRLRKEMTDHGADIVTLSDELYEIQLDRRDIESAQARSLQLISTLLALLFGIIAAVIITRQITRPLQRNPGRGRSHCPRRPVATTCG